MKYLGAQKGSIGGYPNLLRPEFSGVAIRGYETSVVFSRSFLRSAKILLQNGATLRNTLRILNRHIPRVGNAVQSSEMRRNSLGLNYKSAALNQLSYAGIYLRKYSLMRLLRVSFYTPFLYGHI